MTAGPWAALIQPPLETPRQSDPDFPATDRFEVEGVLGRGAFGTVFAVSDRRQGTPLAAKLLHRDHPKALARFKHEFRALADLHHPNLVRLYELHADGAQWFFTMERLVGKDPLAFLDAPGPRDVTLTETGSALSAEPKPAVPEAQVTAASAVDPEALRSVFGQIARGLEALHNAGLVHRDLKPSNIVVDDDGRAKLLDFGLAQSVERSASGGVAGTLNYMAPELLSGGNPSPASDWYAMGVTLHQALAGTVPRRSPGGAALTSPPDADDPLWTLCLSLLAARPGARPSGAAVLRSLGGAPGPTPVWTKDAPTALVGRGVPLQRLVAGLERSRIDGAQVRFIFGASGVGKSALSQAFSVASVERGALLLAGRCFQQETAPLKALDGIVDALAQAMLDDPSLGGPIESVLERRSAVLCSVFPVLRAVPAVEERSDGPRPHDTHEVRRQAFDGLADVVAALSASRPLVLLVDDLQWADAESADAFAQLVRSSESAGFMFAATCRAEERDASAFLERWSTLGLGLDAAERVASIELEALSEGDAVELARQRLPTGATVDPGRIARESGGNPFLVEELARQAQRVQSGSANLWMGLAAALHARVASLPESARLVLELVVIGGRPIDETTISRATGLGSSTFAALDTLRAAHLLRIREQGAVRIAEAYHDRIRETLLGVIDPDVGRQTHRRLADAFRASNRPDHESIARHLDAAGESEAAGEHALLAAAVAEESLAFERAAELLTSSLEGLREDDERRPALMRRQVEALIHCGKGAQAAPILKVLASEGGTHDDLRRAAEQWMISGHLDRGTAALQDVLVRDGLRWPDRPGATMAAVFRDLSFVAMQRGRPKPPPYDPRRLSQVDTCWTGVRGLSSVDHVRGLYFAVHGMRLALSLGEPRRIAKIGMFFAAQLRAMSLPGGARLFERYGGQALASDDPELHAYVDYLEGYVQLQRGEAAAASPAFDRAIARFEAECTGVGWEVSVAMSMLCETLSERGAMHRLADVARDALWRAESLSDTQAAHGAHLFLGLSALAQDQPEHARTHYAEIPEVGVVGGFHYTHFVSALGQCLIDLYEGKEARAWDRMEALVPKLERSGLGRSPFVKCKLLARRGNCAVALLAAAAVPSDAKAVRKQAARCVAGLRKLDRRDARAEATQLSAALASLGGESHPAVAQYLDAAEQFGALGLGVRESLCRVRAAQLSGEDAATATAAIEAAGIRDVPRWADAHAPGVRRSQSS